MFTAALVPLVTLLFAAADAGARPAAPAPTPAPAAATPASTLPLATVIERMQKNYDQAKDFRARFSQKNVSAAFSRTKVSTGEVTFKKPGRMRWDYDKPEAQMFLATGQHLWLYQPADKQAFRQDLKQSQLPGALAFLLGKGKLTDEFEVSLAGQIPYGTARDYRLSLKPKKPQASYKSIYFILDPKTLMVTESVLINAQGDINAITFSDLQVNTKIPDTHFKWTPPPGTKTINADNLSKK